MYFILYFYPTNFRCEWNKENIYQSLFDLNIKNPVDKGNLKRYVREYYYPIENFLPNLLVPADSRISSKIFLVIEVKILIKIDPDIIHKTKITFKIINNDSKIMVYLPPFLYKTKLSYKEDMILLLFILVRRI